MASSDHDHREGVVYTRGVSSEVHRERFSVYPQVDVENPHVTLLDCDDVDALSVHRAATAMDGFTAVWKSSEGSFHLWSLIPRDFDKSILDALELQIADAEHIKQSKQRGCWILRAAPKVRDDGRRYKDGPELRAVYDDGEGEVSKGHLSVVRDKAAKYGVSIPDLEPERVVGSELVTTHSYMTIDDDTKEAIRT